LGLNLNFTFILTTKFWNPNTTQSIEFGVGKKEKKRKGPLVMGFNNKASGILVWVRV
jgi:hypothetical protein